jgi:hypothetical protein
MTLYSPADYECIAAKFRSPRVGSASWKPFYRGDQKKMLRLRGDLEPNGSIGASKIGRDAG